MEHKKQEKKIPKSSFVKELSQRIALEMKEGLEQEKEKEKEKENNKQDTLVSTINALTSLSDLKNKCREYNIPLTGNKDVLRGRVYAWLKMKTCAIRIQSWFRKHMCLNLIRVHGPAVHRNMRSTCVNAVDFLSMDCVHDIPFHEFFSFQDEDGFVYGFNVASFYNLTLKESVKNPFNQKQVSASTLRDFNTLLRYNMKWLKCCSEAELDASFVDDGIMTLEQKIKLRAVSVFLHIDSLGNYTNHNWLLDLDQDQLNMFVSTLKHIWQNMISDMKKSICPDRKKRSPFVIDNQGALSFKEQVISIVENFVTMGINKESQSIGAWCVLTALTSVSHDAACSLPWLFNQFAY